MLRLPIDVSMQPRTIISDSLEFGGIFVEEASAISVKLSHQADYFNRDMFSIFLVETNAALRNNTPR
jgi:hypothetical protein